MCYHRDVIAVVDTNVFVSALLGPSGASRRALVLAVLGTIAGSVLGATAGLPVPVVGPILCALGGAALGAFAGAYLGETWKGRNAEQSLAVGKGAFIDRLLGTVGKLAAGVVMLVVVRLVIAEVQVETLLLPRPGKR